MHNIDAQRLKKNLGEKIKFFRKKRGLSQAQLAEIVNIEMKSLSRIESGHNYPQCENLIALASALEVEPWQLYFIKNEKDADTMKKEIIDAIELDEAKIPALYQLLAVIK